MYTHLTRCLRCKKVVAFLEDWNVEKFPNGWPPKGFVHGCADGESGKGTTKPETVEPIDRDSIMEKYMPFSKCDL